MKSFIEKKKIVKLVEHFSLVLPINGTVDIVDELKVRRAKAITTTATAKKQQKEKRNERWSK